MHSVQLTVYYRNACACTFVPNHFFYYMFFCFGIVMPLKWTRFLIKFYLPWRYDSYFYMTMVRSYMLNAAHNKPKKLKEPKRKRIAEKRRRIRTKKLKKNQAQWLLKQPEWTNERTPKNCVIWSMGVMVEYDKFVKWEMQSLIFGWLCDCFSSYARCTFDFYELRKLALCSQVNSCISFVTICWANTYILVVG